MDTPANNRAASLVRDRGRARLLRPALGAGMGLAVTAMLAMPAEAFFGRPSNPRSAAPLFQEAPSKGARMAAKPRRETASRPKSKAARALPHELAAKAQGPLTVVISLGKQELTLFAAITPIARSRISTGKPGYGTPTGIYSVIEKNRWHWSNLYDDAPMHYMQRITWSGVALHHGIVPRYAASHGCIRMPESFARQLFRVTRLGTRVIVTRSGAAPVDIAHSTLFAPARAADPAVAAETPKPSQPAALKTAMLDGAAPLIAAAAELPGPAGDAAGQGTDKPLKPGPVSVFISRKHGKLYMRKGFAPVLEAPIAIANPDQPVGTHVFTALATDEANGSARWSVISVPSSAKAAQVGARSALDRISIPDDVRARISALLSPGASLIVSDHGLGRETGKGTDFIVQTR